MNIKVAALVSEKSINTNYAKSLIINLTYYKPGAL